MQPMGRKPHRQNFTDCHCKKDGAKNWWEKEGCSENKKQDRQQAKKHINAERAALNKLEAGGL